MGKRPSSQRNTNINAQLALNASCDKRFERRHRLRGALSNLALPVLDLRQDQHTNEEGIAAPH